MRAFPSLPCSSRRRVSASSACRLDSCRRAANMERRMLSPWLLQLYPGCEKYRVTSCRLRLSYRRWPLGRRCGVSLEVWSIPSVGFGQAASSFLLITSICLDRWSPFCDRSLAVLKYQFNRLSRSLLNISSRYRCLQISSKEFTRAPILRLESVLCLLIKSNIFSRQKCGLIEICMGHWGLINKKLKSHHFIYTRKEIVGMAFMYIRIYW